MILYSLIFGFIAWVLPFAAIKRPQHRTALITGSFFCCCVSAVWQFFELQKRVNAGDFAGIEDTIGIITFGVIVMMAVTLACNFLALHMTKNK